MNDVEFGQWLATLGVGGVLAGWIFWFYRKDVLADRNLSKIQIDQLVRVAETVTATIAANTGAIAAMTAVVRSMHDRLDDLLVRPGQHSRDHQRQNISGYERREGNHGEHE